MLAAQFLLLAALSPVPAVDAAAAPLAAPLAGVVAPQGGRQAPSRGGSPPPGGGTPEPLTILLLAGGALGYGALRLRGRKGNGSKES